MVNRGEIVPAEVIPSRERRRLQVRDGAEKVSSASGRVTAPRLIATSGRVPGRAGSRLILVRARRTREVQVIVKPLAVPFPPDRALRAGRAWYRHDNGWRFALCSRTGFPSGSASDGPPGRRTSSRSGWGPARATAAPGPPGR